MRIVHRANRVAQRMYRPQPLLERSRPHRCRAHHVGARFDIGAVGIGARQILFHKPHPLQRNTLGHRMIMGRGKRLDAMGKGIQPRTRRDEFRHPDRQFRVTDHGGGQDLGMKDDLLHMGLGIGDHASAPHFRAGPGGGRHRDDRRDGIGIGAGPPVADILEIPDRSGLPGHEGHHLAQVQPRAAAKGDHPVMAPRVIGRHPGGKVLLVRVRIDIGKDRGPQPGSAHDAKRRRGDRQIGQPPVRDQQRPRDSGVGTGAGQFGNPPRAEFDRGRIGPVSNKAHLVTFFRWNDLGRVRL